MSAFSKFIKLLSMAGGVRAKVDPVTGVVRKLQIGNAALMPTVFEVKAALGIIGQSNEQGTTRYQNAAGAWVRASAAAPSQGIVEPVNLSTAGFGSMFTIAAEILASDGVKVDLCNGAVGGTSLKDWCGFVYQGGRKNSTAYRGKRNSLGSGDLGHRGHMVWESGRLWECTTGNKHLVFAASDTPITVNGADYYSDPGSIIEETSLVSAGSKPTFSSTAIVGDTVADGGLVWTCIGTSALVTDGDEIHVLRYTENGFDPYYMGSRLRLALMRTNVAPDKRFVYIQNGQSDAGTSGAVYKICLRELVRFFGASPYLIRAIVGLSIYYPAQPQASWDVLETEISGGGLAVSPSYATSNLTTALSGLGYYVSNPGDAVASFGFYYGQSLYRSFGISTTAMLQPSDPHLTVDGMYQCAAALAPTLSKILRNSAT